MSARAEIHWARQDDGRLWTIALALSLLGNAAILGFAGLATLETQKFRKPPEVRALPPAAQASVLLSPEMFRAIPEIASASAKTVNPPASAPEFSRTTEEQRGKRPDQPAFIGERDTEATSDRTPDPNAGPLPSISGIAPRHDRDIESTESQYRDGPPEDAGKETSKVPDESGPPVASVPQPMSAENLAVEESPKTAPAESSAERTAARPAPAIPPLAELLQSPNPVETPVSRPKPEESAPPSIAAPPAERIAKAIPPPKPVPEQIPAPKPGEAGFRGNQRKTAIMGSISRTGRSALDVVDSPLGRYQAVISRAVELEWQRNCVRHRDFITPGFLTVRFFVEPTGKVKSVKFVGEMETGEVQKGFTLNSIRDAKIPAMSNDLKSEFAKEPLELIFNFYF